VFDVTFKAYQYNRLQAAKLYAKTNIDGLFNIIEEELKYSGSQNDIMNILYTNEATINSMAINDTKTALTTQYALSEKIIMKRDDSSAENDIYFALFENSSLPITRINKKDETGKEGLWSLHYSSLYPAMTDTAVATKIIEYSEPGNGIQIYLENNATPGNYISPLLYEKVVGDSSDDIPKIEIDDGKNWYGEIIYRTRIYLEAANPTSGEASSIKMERHIPTIDASYTVNIIDDVDIFLVDATNNILTATVVYIVPGFDATFTKTQNFYNWRE